MIRNLAEKIWWVMPDFLRWRLVRFTQKKYTVSVVGIITNELEEVLVLDHYFRLRYSWGLPGGFIEPFEPPEDAIRREIREETDLDLEDLQLIRVRNTGRHIEILFRARGVGEAKVNSREIRETGWFKLDSLPEMSERQIRLLNEILDNNS